MKWLYLLIFIYLPIHVNPSGMMQMDKLPTITKRQLLIKNALSQLGIQEYEGRKSNPEIEKYFYYQYKDHIPWCAAFVNYILKSAGYEPIPSLLAYDFVRYKEEGKRVPGNIVVTKTKRGYHVGILISRNLQISGNYNNRVAIHQITNPIKFVRP